MSARTAAAEAAFAKLRTRKAIDALEVRKGTLIKLPQLDQLLKRHLTALSPTTLTTLFKETFRSFEDSYAATVVVTKELIRRRDVAAQTRVVKVVLAVMKKSDSGRLWETTAYDQLIDSLLPKFEPGPLATLVLGAEKSVLEDDGWSTLFAPALARATKTDEKKLLARLTKHLQALPAADRSKLVAKVKRHVSPAARKSLEALVSASKAEANVEEELRRGTLADAERHLLSLGGVLKDEAAVELSSAICEALRRHAVSEAAVTAYFDFVERNSDERGVRWPEPAALIRLAVLNSEMLEKRVSGLAESARKPFLDSLSNAVVAESARGDATKPHVTMMKALVAKFSGMSSEAAEKIERGEILSQKMLEARNSDAVVAYLEGTPGPIAIQQFRVRDFVRKCVIDDSLSPDQRKAPLALIEPRLFDKFEFHRVSGDVDSSVPAPLLSWLMMLAIDHDDRDAEGKVLARSGQKLELSVFIDLYNRECAGDEPEGDADSFADKASLLLSGRNAAKAKAGRR